MRELKILTATLAALALTACAQSGPSSHVPTRLEANPLGIHGNPAISDGLTEQTTALQASADGLVRSSTLRGAMLGAAVGCGIGVLTSGGSGCLKSVAIGTASGAVKGHLNGQRDVGRRVELASPNGVVRSLRKANGNLANVKETLPLVLAQQDAEVNRLSLAFAASQISKAEHDKRMHAIREERAALAQSLTLTARQAKLAAANMKSATAQGHSGLDWHINATEELARETLSARSTITLL